MHNARRENYKFQLCLHDSLGNVVEHDDARNCSTVPPGCNVACRMLIDNAGGSGPASHRFFKTRLGPGARMMCTSQPQVIAVMVYDFRPTGNTLGCRTPGTNSSCARIEAVHSKVLAPVLNMPVRPAHGSACRR